MDRRTWLQCLAGTAIVLLSGSGAALKSKTQSWLRPPGALSEDAFLAACLRCGQCAEICPRRALSLTGLMSGLALGTPYLQPRREYCDLCLCCIEVCPSGALRPVNKREVRIGLAQVDEQRCLTWNGDVCKICYTRCPFFDEGIRLVDHHKPRVDHDYCVGCGICEYACPLEPAAIVVSQHSRQERSGRDTRVPG